MCTVCGCGSPAANTPEQAREHTHHAHDHDHHEGHGHGHRHDHGHHHAHDHDHGPHGDISFGGGLGGTHVPGLSQARIVQIETDILAHNGRDAAANRARFASLGIFALNLVSSPGAGKTTLLARTARELKDRVPVAVIEGDQETALDADRIRATGVPAVQINTGKGCHLDAHMVAHALDGLRPAPNSVLFIENVGNLVCPAAFDLGEAHKVVILSVTEGEDKPLKYPDMFHAADLMVLNKIDLLPYVDFDVERCVEFARRVRPDIEVMRLSATRGDGLVDWHDWILARRDAARAPASASA